MRYVPSLLKMFLLSSFFHAARPKFLKHYWSAEVPSSLSLWAKALLHFMRLLQLGRQQFSCLLFFLHNVMYVVSMPPSPQGFLAAFQPCRSYKACFLSSSFHNIYFLFYCFQKPKFSHYNIAFSSDKC